MRNAAIAGLAIALALSWLWFWTCPRTSLTGLGNPTPDGQSTASVADTVTVWVDELIGSPDEAYYYDLEKLWNATHPGVKMKMAVMSYAGYQSKLRVAIASGQPPDIATGGLQTVENLKYTGKAPDLTVPIPESFFPKEWLDGMGPLVEKSIVRDGRPTVFPMYRYSYGGVILANREMLADAGFDDGQLRRDGWTFEQFREACRKMTRDLNGDGVPDTWGFGAALVHLNHLFFNEFGPAVWGKEVTKHQFLAQDQSTHRWDLHPTFTEEQVYQVFLLFHQLVNEDKVWNPAYFGMNWNEIIDELVKRRRLGMVFGESPWVPKLRVEIWEKEKAMGAKLEGPPPDLTVVWMPTLRQGDRPVPRAGVTGFSVLKQTPYKGDTHTENALRVAHFLTHPVHLARSQLRQFRHLPPDPGHFGAIYPELLQKDDPWVKYYNEIMDSDIPLVSEPLPPTDPSIPQYLRLQADINRWIEKEGIGYLEQMVYDKLTPREAAQQFLAALRGVIAKNSSSEDTSDKISSEQVEADHGA